jgi:hypothetical protein
MAVLSSCIFTALYTYTNLVPSIARACRDGGKENGLDDVHLLAGEEMHWRIFLVVTLCTPHTLSYFSNPPLQFNDIDTRHILAYLYLITLIPA